MWNVYTHGICCDRCHAGFTLFSQPHKGNFLSDFTRVVATILMKDGTHKLLSFSLTGKLLRKLSWQSKSGGLVLYTFIYFFRFFPSFQPQPTKGKSNWRSHVIEGDLPQSHHWFKWGLSSCINRKLLVSSSTSEARALRRRWIGALNTMSFVDFGCKL